MEEIGPGFQLMFVFDHPVGSPDATDCDWDFNIRVSLNLESFLDTFENKPGGADAHSAFLSCIVTCNSWCKMSQSSSGNAWICNPRNVEMCGNDETGCILKIEMARTALISVRLERGPGLTKWRLELLFDHTPVNVIPLIVMLLDLHYLWRRNSFGRVGDHGLDCRLRVSSILRSQVCDDKITSLCSRRLRSSRRESKWCDWLLHLLLNVANKVVPGCLDFVL